MVGQNLIPSLKQSADLEIIAADKHPANTRTEGKLSFFRSINCCLRQTGQVRHKAKSRTGDLGAFFQVILRYSNARVDDVEKGQVERPW